MSTSPADPHTPAIPPADTAHVRPAAPPPAPASSRPLYRREPWLAILLAALVVGALSFFLPPDARRVGVIVAAVLGVIGLGLLMIHRPDPAAEAEWRRMQRPE
ncbi:MAG TPA: hypothetical protein VFS08_05185 [Gemmatimonadaceae bacterium]|nr:hypothetical protein [Gemmatimonadaceae bacterium]